ncbi:hypothetical protein HYD_0050 [Candidatus Hydrogenosomobacter endosymbioticus]|uniref:Transglycosylase SLT domain-containing protein n=1 Tax=Candidatus Hydrogenosomobacter endosymbioticus TaxID=2558174 RepID=A0ABN6L213_9PROT|nr:hypothetical protein HYD_0050 [Candidatus Hydrogenosomobacter endosymbioticus]
MFPDNIVYVSERSSSTTADTCAMHNDLEKDASLISGSLVDASFVIDFQTMSEIFKRREIYVKLFPECMNKLQIAGERSLYRDQAVNDRCCIEFFSKRYPLTPLGWQIYHQAKGIDTIKSQEAFREYVAESTSISKQDQRILLYILKFYKNAKMLKSDVFFSRFANLVFSERLDLANSWLKNIVRLESSCKNQSILGPYRKCCYHIFSRCLSFLEKKYIPSTYEIEEFSKFYKKLSKNLPEFYIYPLAHAEALLKIYNYKGAISVFNKYSSSAVQSSHNTKQVSAWIKLSAHMAHELISRAKILAANNEYALAKKYFKNAADIALSIRSANFKTYPEEIADNVALAGVTYAFGVSDYKRALELFEYIIHMSEDLPEACREKALARALYWRGVCMEKLGLKESACESFRSAGKYAFSLYGMLALHKANKPFELEFLDLNGENSYRSQAGEDFSELIRLLRHTSMKKRPCVEAINSIVNDFIRSRGASLSQTEMLAYKIAILNVVEQFSKEQAIAFAKKFSYSCKSLFRIAFPDIKLSFIKRPDVDSSLIKAIIVTEPAPDKTTEPAPDKTTDQTDFVVLTQQAQQLIKNKTQLFKAKSNNKKELWSKRKTTVDIEYLLNTIELFSGCYIPAIAAYNSGESNAEKWLRGFDISKTNVNSSLFWIETIPIAETRQYVKNVISNMLLYDYISGLHERKIDHLFKMEFDHKKIDCRLRKNSRVTN